MKDQIIETVVAGVTIVSTAIVLYAGVRLAQKFFGPLEVKIKD